MELLRLPSGAVVEVEVPRLMAVLASGGSQDSLIAAVWAHDMDPDRLVEGDRRYLCEWCIGRLSEDDAVPRFTQVQGQFGKAPSDRLRIDDPVLGTQCDDQFSAALAEAQEDARHGR